MTESFQELGKWNGRESRERRNVFNHVEWGEGSQRSPSLTPKGVTDWQLLPPPHEQESMFR